MNFAAVHIAGCPPTQQVHPRLSSVSEIAWPFLVYEAARTQSSKRTVGVNQTNRDEDLRAKLDQVLVTSVHF